MRHVVTVTRPSEQLTARRPSPAVFPRLPALTRSRTGLLHSTISFQVFHLCCLLLVAKRPFILKLAMMAGDTLRAFFVVLPVAVPAFARDSIHAQAAQKEIHEIASINTGAARYAGMHRRAHKADRFADHHAHLDPIPFLN